MKESTTTVAVRIPQAAYDTLVKVAEAQGKRRSDVLREVITSWASRVPANFEAGK